MMKKQKKTHVLIVEDEFVALDDLRDILEEIGYQVSDAMKAPEAIDILKQGQIDIAILDIHLKGSESGIWIGEQIRDTFRIPFIYLTAFSDKASVELAAATQPYSYLVKPFTKADIFTALELAMKNHHLRMVPGNGQALPHSRPEYDNYIFVKEDYIFIKISLAEIKYVESFKNYLELHVEDGHHVIRSTLKEFRKRLPEDHFLQTHRSYIVNVDHLNQIGSTFVTVGHDEIPLSRSFRDALHQHLGLG